MLDALCSLSDPKRSEANRRLIDELVPDKVPLDHLLSVLRLLLDEKVSIRNLPLILEALAELRPGAVSAEVMCEHVRQRLGFQLVAPLKRADGTLPLVQLATEWEGLFSRYQLDGAGADVALPPEDFSRLAERLATTFQKLTEAGTEAALVTTARRRRFLASVMTARDLQQPVLSFEEIGADARPALVGQVAA